MEEASQLFDAYMKMKAHYEHDYRPHLVPKAIDFIESKLNPQAEVLELGSGSSTVWFAQRAKRIISFEHDLIYYKVVKLILERREIKNVVLILDQRYPVKGVNGLKDKFDFILVDGRGRIKNTRTVVPLLKSGGYFILDDSNRKRYRHARALLNSKNWPHFDFIITEDSPFNFILMTTIWKKP